MRLYAIPLFLLLAGVAACAQAGAAESSNASLSGTVIKEPGGEPLKKALLELIQKSSESAHNYTATSDAEGHFEIQDIVPGPYILLVERTGFLAVDAKHHKNDVVTLTFERGQAIQGLLVRMLPTAVVTGRVLDEDGDPMPGASVALLRRYASGPGRLNQVAAERTNDLGQYRISNILPGRYLVAVAPPLTFESVLGPPKGKDSAIRPEFAYVTTYYPNTTDRAQASPIELRAGDEVPLDFPLTRAPTAHIRGTVANLAPGATATVLLDSSDDSLRLTEADVDKDGKFELHNVAPGTYNLLALASVGDKSMIARHTVAVSGANVDGLRLVPIAEASVRGRMRVPENHGFDFSQISLNLRLVDANSEALNLIRQVGENARLQPDGSFEWKDVAPGSYYIEPVITRDAISNFYLESVMAGGRELRDSALVVSGSPLSLDVVLSPKGAQVDGTVVDDHNQPVANAVVAAVPPEALRKRRDRFERAVTDQHGHFVLRGMTPGDYSLIAWESLDEGDVLLDADFLKPYEEHAVAIRLEKGGQSHVALKVLPAPED